MQNQSIISGNQSHRGPNKSPLAIVKPDTSTGAEWWRGAVIYQIYPRSFLDTNGDGIGDLPGIVEKLDYVASLGVDGIWLSPFFTSPMSDFGYDVSDYCDVDPVFGVMADFDRLVEKAHALGLKVVIDQVYSHSSDQHSWFQESKQSRDNPKNDWYVWADAEADGSPPNNWLSVFGGPGWSWDPGREQYYFHNFLPSQPDLNAHNPEVQEAILDTARFWLDRGVDGFRLDALNFLMHDPQLRDNPPVRDPKSTLPFDCQDHVFNKSHADIIGFLERLRAMMDEYPDTFTVAEIGGEYSVQEMQDYTSGDNRLNTAYGFQFLESDELTPAVIRSSIERWDPTDGVTGWPSWAFSNHDRPRAVSRWGTENAGPEFAKMLVTLLACLRGCAFLYQGEELGLPQGKVPYEQLVDPEGINNWPNHLDRDGTRTPMPWNNSECFAGFSANAPWLPIDARHMLLAVETQEPDTGSVLNYTRAFLTKRQSMHALKQGNLDFIDTPAPLLAFDRTHNGQTLRCVFNLSPDQQAFTISTEGLVVWATDGAEKTGPLPAYGCMILEVTE